LKRRRPGGFPAGRDYPVLKVYNTLTRQKQQFIPIAPGRVRIYVCGMTVYDYCHLGHARVMVVFDMVSRWLRACSFDVCYVRNITDIDDKIIARAAQNNESIDALTSRFIDAMHEDTDALGVMRPDFEPRATEYVGEMIATIAKLLDKNLAYATESGDVYYAVHKFPGYGKLSGKTLDDLRAGERIELDPAKRDPLDFALWKAAKPGEPAWEAPWGAGRPGWHIECSAMSTELLGPHFDIHGGGQDLEFPHHENEIAQSEGAHGETFVNYWMHNGFVRVDEVKMSKSLGNFFTVREVLARYDPEVIRFFMLRSHYRSPLNYSDQHLEDAKQSLDSLYIALRGLPAKAEEIDWQNPYAARFREAMNDDFDSHSAITALFELLHEVNRTRSSAHASLLKSLAAILGLLQRDSDAYLKGWSGLAATGTSGTIAVTEADDTSGASGIVLSTFTPQRIDQLVAERAAAREAKNYVEADRIRRELAEAGIVLEDSASGTTWRRA
jgi:cysteinyl-tRNA synthetase